MIRKRPTRKVNTQMKQKDISILREKLLAEQNGICPICNKIIDDPVLDHEHKKKLKGTGLIRGVLCRTCNVLLAKSENNCIRYRVTREQLPRILRRMSRYLRKEHLPFIHPSEKEKQPILQRSSYNELKKAYSGRAKFPEYRMRKDKKTQTLTKGLGKLFEQYCIVPKFYSKG